MVSDLQVMIEVQRPDGSQELLRVGTARRSGEFLVLDLMSLRLQAETPSQPAAPRPALKAAPALGSVEELEYIAARARKTLADPSKAKWHREEKDLLGRVERELDRLRSSP